MRGDRQRSFNLADAKKRLSELVGRVAFGGEEVLITRRGRPMARLVPPDDRRGSHLADVRGWLDDGDPLFDAVEAAVAARSGHRPRVLPGRARRRAGRSR